MTNIFEPMKRQTGNRKQRSIFEGECIRFHLYKMRHGDRGIVAGGKVRQIDAGSAEAGAELVNIQIF